MVVRTGKDEIEQIDAKVQQGTIVQGAEYLEIVINTEGNIKKSCRSTG